MGETDIAVYGDREDVREVGARIQKFQKPAKEGMELTQEDAQRAAQYALAVDANPFRGEIYAFKNKKGEMLIVEGYKLLVRWARRQCPYSERYVMLTDEEKPSGSIGWRCWILRKDSTDMLREMKSAGATFQEAFEIVATDAVGVVRQEEMKGYNQPPKGWTWDQVAKKRALKNALNKSHGAPSPREIAKQSWEVGTTDTTKEDWVQVEEMPKGVIERAAAASAQARERVYAEHERDTALPAESATRGSAKLFLTTEADPAPARVVDQDTGEIIDGQIEEPPVPPWTEELATEGPPDEPEAQEPDDSEYPSHWTHFSTKVMDELGYPKRADILETLKANGVKKICKSDGICVFDRAKAWDILVQAMGG